MFQIKIKKEEVKIDFQLTLQKDLNENEVVCTHCKGSGLVIGKNAFGLSGERKGYNLYPYKKEVIQGCPNCYNGVQKVCKHCSNTMLRSKYQCDCEGSKREIDKKYFEMSEKKWNDSVKISYKEALEKYDMVFIDNDSKYIDMDELEEFIFYMLEDSKEEGSLIELNDIRVYGTKSTNLTIDVADIFEMYSDSLHEDAIENIPKEKIEELDNFLTNWCSEVGNRTTTYFVDEKVGILIDGIFKK